MTQAKEIVLSYSVYFQEGWNFNLGGKLPGLFGGVNESIAVTCSGGEHDPGCFSARLMFRPNGTAELYLYIPEGLNDNDNKCGEQADELCTTTYGESVGRGTWDWKPGQWQIITERILLNTPGQADGEAEIYLDGQSVLKVGTITWRSSAEALIRGIQMQIFFGGHTPEWESPQDQDAYFADFSVGILQQNAVAAAA